MEQKFREKLIMADNEQGRIARDEILDRWEATEREKQYFENLKIALKNCDEKHLYKTMEEFTGRKLTKKEKGFYNQLINKEKKHQAKLKKLERKRIRLERENKILRRLHGEESTECKGK
ncbi:hypothetical protein [Priestia megaterium]|uniref:hypothetical protein n=1 Tax=Priestia megaterium TaxID=1404 RepID=UPI001BEBBA8F|nr:hypothetical protein [Priestia megaterium]MBT2257069.1 hypothetical protein [Priestia megaterium]MBT2276717.1 hypothetical protein [Priestia megaterium]